MNNFDVITTLNLHLLNSEMLTKLSKNGASIFRINGSHIRVDELNIYSSSVREVLGKEAKLLIDLPGNKIRTSILSQPIVLQEGKSFDLHSDQINYPGFLENLVEGDLLLANDSLFKFRVEEIYKNKVRLLSYTDGALKSNKGLHLVGKTVKSPFLFDKDHALIEEAKKCEVDYIGFSFVRTVADVEEARKSLKNSSLGSIFKIETASAVKNLDQLIPLADNFLVDRGDLSCDIGIENVDRIQKFILRTVKKHPNKRIFFATQFFHSMLENNVPLISEICGFSDAVNEGVDGIQLSEETAVGKHPLEILQLIQNTLNADSTRRRIKQNREIPVLWLTGQSGSGKTTLAKKLNTFLEYEGLRSCLIDGDEFRAFWGDDQNYSREGRVQNQKNLIQAAYQATKNTDIVIVSSLSPYRDLRAFAAERLKNFHEVYLKCSIEECKKRDPKGLYRKAQEGELKNFIGVSSAEVYEEPLNPNLVIDTERTSQLESLNKIIAYLLN